MTVIADKRFPLVRTFWSNEKAMALLFGALVAWQIPAALVAPDPAAVIARFVALVALSLFVDMVCNLLRYRRFLCSVSAAVTAGVVFFLAPFCAPEASYPVMFGAVATALVVGKHLPGGTGKNRFNPSMIALALMALAPLLGLSGPSGPSALSVESVPVAGLLVMVVALFASFFFATFRPFAAFAFLVGAAVTIALAASGAFGMAGSIGLADPVQPHDVRFLFIAVAAAFTAFIAMTDPVTVTANPVVGSVAGLLAGIVSGAALSGSLGLESGSVPFVILSVNAVSFVFDRAFPQKSRRGFTHFSRLARNAVKPSTSDSAYFPAQAHSNGNVDGASPILEFPAEEALSLIESSCIVGLGGAGFPTSAKIATLRASSAKKKILIINAVECDPGLEHDKWLLAYKGAEIIEAMSILRKVSDCTESALAVKRGTPVSRELSGYLPEGTRLVRIPNRYPCGAERLLIKIITGVSVPDDEVPSREGFLVLNVQTALAVRDALLASLAAENGLCAGGDDSLAENGSPRGRAKYITLTDLRARESRVVRISEGEPIDAVFSREFPASASCGTLFVGGGLMQARWATDGEVVGPDVNFIARGDAPRFRESPQCSRCGLCAARCPAGLDAREIANLVDSGEIGRAAELGASRCLSCGTCSAVCLAGRNLSWRVSTAKRSLADSRPT